MISSDEGKRNKLNVLNKNSRVSHEMPIVINCAGKISITKPFITHNTSGRLDYYLMYITDGKLNVEIDGENEILTVGDFIIFPPKYKYKYGLSSGSISYYFVHFTGSHTDKYFEKLGITQNPKRYHSGHTEDIAKAFSSFYLSYENKNELSGLASSVEFSRVLVLLSKAYRFGNAPSPLGRSLAYINGSYTEVIRVPKLAAMEGLSVSRYNAVFRESVGVSPVTYITNLRMRQACTLLEGTDLTVKQISETVGYTDNHFFSKLFKSYIGLSPVAYRENNR